MTNHGKESELPRSTSSTPLQETGFGGSRMLARNPKFEIRDPKEIRSPKTESSGSSRLSRRTFPTRPPELVSAFEFRSSGFVLRTLSATLLMFCLSVPSGAVKAQPGRVLTADAFRHYADTFSQQDQELYSQVYANSKPQYANAVEAMDQWGGTISISLAGLFWVKDNHGSNASPAGKIHPINFP